MFMQHKDIAPDRAAHLLARAEAAARAIPPAFPLDATVAVNPFLGQTEEDLAHRRRAAGAGGGGAGHRGARRFRGAGPGRGDHR